ncbi:ParB/Srx family N-terminal domain-containing protein [Streptomyces sp. NRRL F-5630]|uniref:ParB/Srx family N-terminal domain-containing protein n=1 Tax=Streptomyces sp. NRRL F-5630 TaxID=1463864 RepID=UPI003EBD463B
MSTVTPLRPLRAARRLGASLAATAALLAAAPQAGAATPTPAARPGDLLAVRLDQLHPTQPSVGKDQIFYKLGRYGSPKDEQAGDVNKRFDDWCETNGQGGAKKVPPGARLADPASFTCAIPLGQETDESRAAMKTAVVGPGGRLYLTDGHHSLTSFWEAADGGPGTSLRLRVQADFSELSQSAFWDEMRARHWVWLRDEHGAPVTTDQLPTRLGLSRFHDDPYRSLVYFTRDIGYTAPEDAAEYLEFLWGDWLRERLDLGAYDLDDPASYLQAVRDASELMVAADPDEVIADGRTAAELGRLDEWNDGKKPGKGEFGKLSQPLTAEKPGKLAFALAYRSRVVAPSRCTTTLRGPRTGPLVVASGVTCLDNTRQTGPVVVRAGASLVALGAEVTGPVQAVGARDVYLCGTTVDGPLSVTGSRLRTEGPGCSANSFGGPVQLVANTRG